MSTTKGWVLLCLAMAWTLQPRALPPRRRPQPLVRRVSLGTQLPPEPQLPAGEPLVLKSSKDRPDRQASGLAAGFRF